MFAQRRDRASPRGPHQERAYVQVVMPGGAVGPPREFAVFRLGAYGNLLVLMRDQCMLVALKLGVRTRTSLTPAGG